MTDPTPESGRELDAVKVCRRCDGSGYVTVWMDSIEPACRKRSVRCMWCNPPQAVRADTEGADG